ncbi:MAG TPA: four helix bundle protein [Chthoniobacterales bacterium]|jgi:four helix bundle protein|nr:four helix bundle protein [Chthoniobacterales bacterium]
MFNFEKLDVWKKSIELADTIYSRTRPFPAEERFGLTTQLRRAAVSVSSNIAEGSSRSSKVDFARFIEIGTGSIFELVSQIFIAQRQGFLSEENFQELYRDAQEIGRMLSGLRNSLAPK